MIIKDEKQKKELDKIPDRDRNGEPIYKIDADAQSSDAGENQKEEFPVFLQGKTDTSQGNTQDIKDSTEESMVCRL